VDDCAEGILKAAALYNDPDPVNLGNGNEVWIRDLVHLIAELSRYKGEIIWRREQPDGQPRRQLDTSKALEKFGFRATTTLADGLRRTIDWFEGSTAATRQSA
jgi:GDP-L-fucose synthase